MKYAYRVELTDMNNELIYSQQLETDTRLDEQAVLDFVHKVITDYDLQSDGPDKYQVTLFAEEDNG